MGCAEAIVKLLVFGANLVFALAGLALLVVGVLYKIGFDNYTRGIPQDYEGLSLAPILTIVIGSIIFIIAFFGCCGAIRDSTCLLTSYAVILIVIFLVQVGIAVYAFLMIKNYDNLEQKVDGQLTTLFNSYYNNNASKEIVDVIQDQFKCCGRTGPKDWTTIPASCYKDNKLYSDGCSSKFINFLYDSVKIIGIVVLSFSALEIIGAIFSLCLSSSIKNRERRFRY